MIQIGISPSVLTLHMCLRVCLWKKPGRARGRENVRVRYIFYVFVLYLFLFLSLEPMSQRNNFI